MGPRLDWKDVTAENISSNISPNVTYYSSDEMTRNVILSMVERAYQGATFVDYYIRDNYPFIVNVVNHLREKKFRVSVTNDIIQDEVDKEESQWWYIVPIVKDKKCDKYGDCDYSGSNKLVKLHISWSAIIE